MRPEEAIKFFGQNNLSIEAEIRRIERELGVDFGHTKSEEQQVDQDYYPQFRERFRKEAKRMAINYAIFYCLENTIRDLITQRLKEYGKDWWDTKVPGDVRKRAGDNRKREEKSGVTPRSTEMIDFTNFGELGEIIKANWDAFSDVLRDVSAVERILNTLNTLRAPIAHCKALAEDEESRLHLGLRDWFRQME